MEKTINEKLRDNGISIICEIDKASKNSISAYVAKTLVSKFPNLRLNYDIIYSSVNRLPMYIALMNVNSSGACYFYENSSIYFRRGLSLEQIKKLAVHECIHYFQEIRNGNGKIKKMGLCTFVGKRAVGNAINEASVQLMSAYATNERPELVKYYGISLRADSPSFYPIICNLIKQMGYLAGFPILFESTFYANDDFYKAISSLLGENNVFKIQDNMERILNYESQIENISVKVRTENLDSSKFNKCTEKMALLKKKINKTYFDTQNIIVESFFDRKLKKVKTPQQIEVFRKYLYRYSSIIGTSENYTFFNDYYIKKMQEIDSIYERMSGNTSMQVYKPSKIKLLFKSIINLLTSNNENDESLSFQQNYQNKKQ